MPPCRNITEPILDGERLWLGLLLTGTVGRTDANLLFNSEEQVEYIQEKLERGRDCVSCMKM